MVSNRLFVSWLLSSTKPDRADSSGALGHLYRGTQTSPVGSCSLSKASDSAEDGALASCVPIQNAASYSLNVLENLRTRLETITFTTKNSMTTFWFSVTES